MAHTTQPIALVTGGGRGFGHALARVLLDEGWRVVVDARRAEHLANELPGAIVVPGDVTDVGHRAALAGVIAHLGRLDLLVANASELGPSPLPTLADHPLEALHAVYETNVIAPVALAQLLLPHLRTARGTLVTLSSDAALEAYPGWGGYGSSKAALDHVCAVLAAEEPTIHAYAFDPGDMRTEMHQAAFPGEDISDRPDPATVVPALLRLVSDHPASGRYRAADLLEGAR